MPRDRIKMILEIHYACTNPLYSIMEGITEDQLNFKPAPDSRSINQIMCHLIRVDNYFLKRLNQPEKFVDPRNGTAGEILQSLKNVHSQIRELLENCDEDSILLQKSGIENAKEEDTINEHILHSCQHNLYHLSQMIYLRRVQDRSWNSPIEAWDKATRIIASYLVPVKAN